MKKAPFLKDALAYFIVDFKIGYYLKTLKCIPRPDGLAGYFP